MNFKKHLFNICCSATFLLNSTVLAAPSGVIPYPNDLDIHTEGASSAPAEINHTDSPYFTAPDFYNMTSSKWRTIITHFPSYQQSRENTCGPAAALTVLYYFGKTDETELSLAAAMKTQPYPIGTTPGDMVNYFKHIGWHVESNLDGQSFTDYIAFADFVRTQLQQNHPIMVENVEWGGHWRVIIGYDTMGTDSWLDDVLILADPYDTCDHQQDGYAVQNATKFYAMWFDHSMLPKEQASQPFILAYPQK